MGLCYILHHKALTESKAIISFLTPEQGFSKGVIQTNSKASIEQKYPQFQQGEIAYIGHAELKKVSYFEPIRIKHRLAGKSLYCGIYLNELLQRILLVDDPQDEIFFSYSETLNNLEDTSALEPILRRFEFNVLATLGYGIDFEYEYESGEPIEPSQDYQLISEYGFSRVRNKHSDSPVVPGHVLHSIARGDYSHKSTLQWSKRISRACLAPLLGSKPLKSRELFQ